MGPYPVTMAVLLLGVFSLLGRSQPPACPDGKVYNSCGTACPLTCDNYQDTFACTTECVPGCFCPQGQVQHNERCVDPEDCSNIVDDDNPCEGDSGCRDDQLCEVFVSGCGAEDDYCHHYPLCKNPPYVPCGSDAFLACDSEWTYCLQQNKTRRAHCVGSCLSDNGNCGDQVCITTVSDTDSPRIQCVDPDDLSTDCPAGQILDDSGCVSVCQETCQDVVRGTLRACPEICIVDPTCVCPMGLVQFRDRCVDPRLCYILLTYPPAIQPLPIVDPNTVLLSLNSRSVSSHQFGETEQNRLTGNVQTALTNGGYSEVFVTIHGIYEDNSQLQIVIVIRGNSVSQSSITNLLDVLRQNSNDLGISIEEFNQVDVDYVEEEEKEDVLSTGAIVGIAVSSVIAGFAIMVAWISIITCCCVLKGNSKRKTVPSKVPQGDKSSSYTNIIFHEEDLETLDKDDLKSEVALESLCD